MGESHILAYNSASMDPISNYFNISESPCMDKTYTGLRFEQLIAMITEDFIIICLHFNSLYTNVSHSQYKRDPYDLCLCLSHR